MFFPLHPETPSEGLALRQLFGPQADLRSMHARMESLMRAEGLPYGERTHTYNSRLAQEFAKWAETEPGGDAVHAALFRAYFVEGQNIGDREVLVRIAEAVGLRPEAAREALVSRQYRLAVDADWARSVRLGITGVPTFRVGAQSVVGAQPYEVLEQLVTTARHVPSAARSPDE